MYFITDPNFVLHQAVDIFRVLLHTEVDPSKRSLLVDNVKHFEKKVQVYGFLLSADRIFSNALTEDERHVKSKDELSKLYLSAGLILNGYCLFASQNVHLIAM